MDDRSTNNAIGHLSVSTADESGSLASFLQQSFELMTEKGALAEYVEALQSGHVLVESVQLLAKTIDELTLRKNSEEETAEVCDRLGYMKAFLFKATGVHSVIDDAIELGRQAVASTPILHPKRATRLDNLGFSLSARHHLTDNLDDLQESIRLAKESLEVSPSTDPDRGMYLLNLSARLIRRHQKTRQSKDLEEGIDMAYQVVREMDLKSDAHDRAVALCNLTTLLLFKFKQTGFRRDLDEALRIAHLAQSCSTLTGETRALILSNLASLHAAKYSITGKHQDLQDSAKYSSQSAQITPPFVPERRVRILLNALYLTALYPTTRSKDDMDRAFLRVSEVMQEHQRDPYHGAQAIKLHRVYTFLYGQRFLDTPNIENWLRVVNGGIYLLGNPFYIDKTGLKDFDHRQEALRRLEVHRARFHVVIEELDEMQIDADTSLEELSLLSPMASRILSAMHETYRKMIRVTNPVDALVRTMDGPVKIRLDGLDLAELGRDTKRDFFSFGLKSIQYSYRLNYPLTLANDPTLVKQEIKEHLDSQGISDSPDTFSTEALLKLSRLYARLHASSQQQEDLQTAIQYSETCLQRMDETDPNRTSRLCTLVQLYESKDAVSQNPLDLQYIIRYSEMALRDPNISQKDLLSILPSFSSAARISFQQSSDMAELDKAAHAIKLAIMLSPSMMDARLPYTLAMTLKTRYQATGEFRSLDIAAQMMEQALALQERDSDIVQIPLYVNYALILRLRFLHTHGLDDINRALSLCQRALVVCTDPRLRPGVLNNLTLILYTRYNATDDADNIDLAIRYAEEALAIVMSMEGDARLNTIHAAILTNLANSLSIRFSLTQDPSDIGQVIEYGSQGLSFATSASKGMQNSDLSESFQAKYQSTKQREDLDSAILYATEALKYISDSHPTRPLALIQMALCRLDQENPSNIDQAIACLNEAFDCTTGSPGDRICAAQLAAKHLVRGQKMQEAASLLERAVGLMPELGAKWDSSRERQQSVVLCYGLPANAAMVAMEAGLDPSFALKTLELGRAIIMGSMMDYRREVPVVKDGFAKGVMEELIKEFNHVRMKVDDAEPGHARRNLMDEMGRILWAIRALPGYEDFLAPPTSDDFLRLAKDGPIVIVLTSELIDHGAAILVTPTKIIGNRLPLLTHDEATRRMHDLSENILDLAQGAWNQRNQDMFKLLKWLWEAVVAPVCGPDGLDVLHEGRDLARLRWVGVGVLSKAPFHIAGNYALKTPNDRITKYAISSYAPSLRALLYASDRKPKQYLHHKVDARILLTKIVEAEGVDPLENVEKEINAIQKVSDSVPMESLVLDSPSAEEILQQLPLHNLVHFACHAVADPNDPSESHLILVNGRLRVGDIVRAHAAEPDVAFLSACSTAETRDVRLADESIHIASAFLMVGFKHVVGTLWQAPDKICMKVAELFYRRLLCDEGVDWDGRWKVAEALHAATTEVQNRLPGSPLGWGPFVAFGA